MSTKPQKIKAVRDFFTDERLQSLNLKFQDDTILTVIDVQWLSFEFKKNKWTDRVAKRINSQVPKLRAYLPVYNFFIVHPQFKHHLDTFLHDRAGPYEGYTIAPEDQNILKAERSILPRFNAKAAPQHQQAKLVLMAGVNLNACVLASARTMRRAGYEVCVLTDLVTNDNTCRRYPGYPETYRCTTPQKAFNTLSRMGVFLERSEEVIEYIQEKKSALSL